MSRKRTDSKVSRQPVDQVILVGTKAPEGPSPRRRRQQRLGRGLGQDRPVRVRRQLVHQHRQRLLRRPAVHAEHLARVRRHRHAEQRQQRRRSPSPRRSRPLRAGAPGPPAPRSWASAEPARPQLGPGVAGRLDLRPTKQRGQNFVTDANTVRRIVAVVRGGRRDVVLEIGPGLGSLTLGLLEVADQVVAVEIDELLAGELPRTVAERMPERADALRWSPPTPCGSTTLPGRADRGRGQPALQRLGAGAAAPAGHVRELAARAGHGPGRGRRPAGGRAGLEDLRRALGEDGLVRRRHPGRHRAADRLLAGAQRRVGAGRPAPSGGAGDHRHPRADLRGGRRRLRPAAQDAPLGAGRSGRLVRAAEAAVRGRRAGSAGPGREARR